MSKNSDKIILSLYGDRWQTNSAPNAGTTCVATVSAPLATQRRHIDSFWYSIRNMMGAGAANCTVTINVAHAAGTVIATVDHLVGPSQTANVAMTPHWFGKKGGAVSASMNTVVASVTQKINMAGWTEDVNG